MTSRTRKPVFLAAFGALALATAACQQTLLLDDVNLENILTQRLEQQGVTVNSIDCPDDRPLQQGDNFTCTADTDAGPLVFNVTQTDNQGNVTFSLQQ
jgi:hypothetical protein